MAKAANRSYSLRVRCSKAPTVWLSIGLARSGLSPMSLMPSSRLRRVDKCDRSPRTAARDRWNSRRQSSLSATVLMFQTSTPLGATTWTPTALPLAMALALPSPRLRLTDTDNRVRQLHRHDRGYFDLGLRAWLEQRADLHGGHRGVMRRAISHQLAIHGADFCCARHILV